MVWSNQWPQTGTGCPAVEPDHWRWRHREASCCSTGRRSGGTPGGEPDTLGWSTPNHGEDRLVTHKNAVSASRPKPRKVERQISIDPARPSWANRARSRAPSGTLAQSLGEPLMNRDDCIGWRARSAWLAGSALPTRGRLAWPPAVDTRLAAAPVRFRRGVLGAQAPANRPMTGGRSGLEGSDAGDWAGRQITAAEASECYLACSV